MTHLDLSTNGRHTVVRISLSHLGEGFDWWRVVEDTGAILGSGFSRAEAIERAKAELKCRATKTGSNDER